MFHAQYARYMVPGHGTDTGFDAHHAHQAAEV
jgi:hypothetical protein